MRVKTDYEGCEYITAGKEYEAERIFDGAGANIIDDNGTPTTLFLSCCAHLDGVGTWEVLE